MKHYVVVFVDPGEDLRNKEVLLVHKDRPAWQAGKFNLVGGKLEDGETAIFGGVRELKEESGLDPTSHADYKGMIYGDNSMIHVVQVSVDRSQPIQPREGETEVVSWHNWEEIGKDKRLMPNLRLIIPFLQSGVKSIFSLRDTYEYNAEDNSHKVFFAFADSEDKPISNAILIGDEIICEETGESFLGLLEKHK